jgi:hypothetical protein
MRVAILSESSADEAAIRILAEAVLGCKTVAVVTELRSRGWPAVRDVLPAVIRKLHFRAEADGLIVVVDSNHTSLGDTSPKNRLQSLRSLAAETMESLRPVPAHPPLRVAVGVASPALEAWLLCHRHQDVGEASWEKGLRENRDPYSRLELKKRLYEVERPSLRLETEKMIEAADELRNQLTQIEARFPLGFAGLAAQLRDWRRVDS